VTRLFSKFSQSYKLIVASQCPTFPIIANVTFHWTFPRMRRARGVAVGPRVLCAQQVLLQRHGHRRSLARLHASPPRLELLDASTKAPRLLQRFFVLFQLPRDSQRFARKKQEKRIEFLCWNSSSGVILLAYCVCAISFCSFSSMPLSKSPKASDLNSVSLTQISLSLCLSLGFWHLGVFVCFFSFSSHCLRSLLFSVLPRSQKISSL
jgi:hypothetical protein